MERKKKKKERKRKERKGQVGVFEGKEERKKRKNRHESVLKTGLSFSSRWSAGLEKKKKAVLYIGTRQTVDEATQLEVLAV